MSFVSYRKVVLQTLLATMVAVTAPMPLLLAEGKYPTRPVKLLLPFAPGGSIDVLARATAKVLTDRTGQQFYVENRSGAGGLIGYGIAAESPKDGYTLLFTGSHFASAPFLYKNVTYDPIKDFQPVSLVASVPLILVVTPGLPVSNVQELIALAKAQSDKVNFGSSGAGGGTHLSGELFNQMTGTKMQHIPYRGGGPATQDLIGGQIQVMFASVSTTMPHVYAGRVKPIAWTGEKRLELLPDLPTVAESGVPGFSTDSWAAVFAPTGTPKEIVDELARHMQEVVKDPAFRKQQLDNGTPVIGSDPEYLRRFLKADMDKWGPMIKKAGITMD